MRQPAPKKRRIPKREREDFAAFCRQASDAQIISIEAKERKANRRTLLCIAQIEMERRGLA